MLLYQRLLPCSRTTTTRWRLGSGVVDDRKGATAGETERRVLVRGPTAGHGLWARFGKKGKGQRQRSSISDFHSIFLPPAVLPPAVTSCRGFAARRSSMLVELQEALQPRFEVAGGALGGARRVESHEQ